MGSGITTELGSPRGWGSPRAAQGQWRRRAVSTDGPHVPKPPALGPNAAPPRRGRCQSPDSPPGSGRALSCRRLGSPARRLLSPPSSSRAGGRAQARGANRQAGGADGRGRGPTAAEEKPGSGTGFPGAGTVAIGKAGGQWQADGVSVRSGEPIDDELTCVASPHTSARPSPAQPGPARPGRRCSPGFRPASRGGAQDGGAHSRGRAAAPPPRGLSARAQSGQGGAAGPRGGQARPGPAAARRREGQRGGCRVCGLHGGAGGGGGEGRRAGGRGARGRGSGRGRGRAPPAPLEATLRLVRAGPAALELQRVAHARGPGQRPGLPLPGRPGPAPAAGLRRRRAGRARRGQPGQHLLRLLQGHRPQEERRPHAGGPHPGAAGRGALRGPALHAGLRVRRRPLLPVAAAARAPGAHLLRGPVGLLPLHRRDRIQVRGPGRPRHPHHLWAAGRDVCLRSPGGLPGRLPAGLRHSSGPEHRGHPPLQQHQGHGVRPGGRHRHTGHPHRPHAVLCALQRAALPALRGLQRPGHLLQHQPGAAPAHHPHGLLPGEAVPEPDVQQAAPADCQAQPPARALLRLWHHLGTSRQPAQTLRERPSAPTHTHVPLRRREGKTVGRTCCR